MAARSRLFLPQLRLRRHRPVQAACIRARSTYYRGMQIAFRALCGAALVGAAFSATGCRAPAQPVGPTEIVLHLPDYDAFVDSTLSTLRLYDFPPDYVDRQRGVIVSKPTTAGQWFEIWRKDVPSPYLRLESSLHTIHQIVTVQIQSAAAPSAEEAAAGAAPVAPSPAQPPVTEATAPGEEETPPAEGQPAPHGAGRYLVSVRVDRSRLTTPERQVTTPSGALAMYSRRMPTVEGVRATARDEQWVPLGRDGLLEADILASLSDVLPGVQVSEE